MMTDFIEVAAQIVVPMTIRFQGKEKTVTKTQPWINQHTGWIELTFADGSNAVVRSERPIINIHAPAGSVDGD